MDDTAALALAGVDVTFPQRDGPPVVAARAARLDVAAGAWLGISGPSGSGKTTLLHVIAGLLPARAGSVCWGTADLARMSEGARDRWRRAHVGFVFQDFHLVPELSARDNVLLPAWFGGWRADAAARQDAEALLSHVGIPDPKRRARLLSRGEQQRVAIARALFAQPSILLADEPTASLDGETGARVADLLTEAAGHAGATLIVVSHDPSLLARMTAIRHMEKGHLLS